MRGSRGRALSAVALLLSGIALVVGCGASTPRGGRAVDVLGLELTRRFEPAFAPGVYAALGPQAPFYLAIFVLLLSASLLGDWRRAHRAILGGCLAGLIALGLWALGAMLFARPAPVLLDPGLPIPEDWRVPWQARGAYPSRHAALAASLAGSTVLAWVPLGLPAAALALGGALAAVYFGAAHATDAAVGLGVGGLSSVAGRIGADLLLSGRLK